MTKANPRVEIYFRMKGKKRWLRTERVYRLDKIEEAQKKMVELFNIHKGKRQYILKPLKN